MTREHELIVLAHDLPEHGLARGDVGVVVHAYPGGEGFEVEFATGDGETLAVVTLGRDDVRPLRRRDILHVRDRAA